jgi:hypothetical protein
MEADATLIITYAWQRSCGASFNDGGDAVCLVGAQRTSAVHGCQVAHLDVQCFVANLHHAAAAAGYT